MKICFFANAHNLHVRELTAGFARRGHEVHVVTHKPVEIPQVNVERFTVPPPGVANLHRWRGRWRQYLEGHLRRFDINVVFFLHDWGFAPEILDTGCLIASPRGSDIVPPPGERAPSPESVEKRIALLRSAAGVGVGGPTFAGAVADFAGINVERIELLPLGVDLDLFRPAESPPREAADTHRVGFFKGFREVYGAAYLLQAMPAVLEAFPDTCFDLIGEGPTLAPCHRLADKLGIASSIRWIPRQPHRDMPSHLEKWGLSVMPSLCESFGLAALESSAMGIPVVASRVGGLVDTVHDGVTGLLVPPRSPRNLAEAMISLLADAPLRQEMGRAGRDFVRCEYGLSKILDDWEAVFQRTLDRVSVMF